MRAVDVIRRKRDGEALSPAEVDFFVQGASTGAIPEYQVAALLMAIVLRGMSPSEAWWLTDAMVRSGLRLNLADIPGPKVDKHSTGGVGDKTSLIVAPLAAACGARVPMMSGRALGHTGGTLDKLESIPGFRTHLTVDELRAALVEVGAALVGQSAQVAPADARLYALRDVTATIESVPLIAASIMSKKIAEGIEALVLDVKAGRGAFMKSEADARYLAAALVAVGERAGIRTAAFITAMDAPLGRAVGNALEVVECLETLKGRGPADLESLSLLLAARMLEVAGIAASPEVARQRVRAALTSGAGLEKLRQIIAHQGGDPRVIDDYDRLPVAPRRWVVRAPRTGYLAALDALLIGQATMALGAGRDRVDAPVDHAVGARLLIQVGDPVKEGDGVIELHYGEAGRLEAAAELAGRAIAVAEAPPPRPLVLGTVP